MDDLLFGSNLRSEGMKICCACDAVVKVDDQLWSQALGKVPEIFIAVAKKIEFDIVLPWTDLKYAIKEWQKDLCGEKPFL